MGWRHAATAATLAFLLSACGAGDDLAGTYVMGDAQKAIDKATAPPKECELAGMTLADLAKSDKTYTFSATVDIVLKLKNDQSFTYYGPLKMGDEERMLTGTWKAGTGSVTLHFDKPQISRGETIHSLLCRMNVEKDIHYPMGRDPKNVVYYALARTD